jgi:hypothetical protein
MTKITPPPELIEKWITEAERLRHVESFEVIAAKIVLLAYKAGADQELEACCEWFQEFYKTESWVNHDLKHFRNARRPKQPSLKEQALSLLAKTDGPIMLGNPEYRLRESEVAIIRRALEQIDD